MKKILNICQKDIAIIMRDKGAMVLMLLAPILLTLGNGCSHRFFLRAPGQHGYKRCAGHDPQP